MGRAMIRAGLLLQAILEHVLFCHQEESNWPLQEGNVVKKRFDEIFESSRYTKAQEQVVKLKKTKAKELKVRCDTFWRCCCGCFSPPSVCVQDAEGEKNVLEAHLTQAMQLEDDKSTKETRM